LCRPSQLAQADHITAAHCVHVLSSLVTTHEYVVVDGPCRFDLAATSVLDVSDHILLVLQLVVPCVRNVHRMLDGMRGAGFNMGRIKLVCNRVGLDGGNLSLQDVKSTLGVDVFAAIPNDWLAMSTSVNLGEPLATCHPKSKVRLAIRELAERLHRPSEASDDTPAPRKGGLLGRIFADAS